MKFQNGKEQKKQYRIGYHKFTEYDDYNFDTDSVIAFEGVTGFKFIPFQDFKRVEVLEIKPDVCYWEHEHEENTGILTFSKRT